MGQADGLCGREGRACGQAVPVVFEQRMRMATVNRTDRTVLLSKGCHAWAGKALVGNWAVWEALRPLNSMSFFVPFEERWHLVC